MENVYKPREVADMLRVSYETVLDWIDQKTLPAYQLPSGHYRIYEWDVEKAMLPTGRSSSRKPSSAKTATRSVTVWKQKPLPRRGACLAFGATQPSRPRFFATKEK